MNKRRNIKILQASIGMLLCMHVLSGNYSFLHNLHFGPGINFSSLMATEARVSRAHYDIRILAIDGEALHTPLYFSQSSDEILEPGEFTRESGMRLIRKFGYALATQSDQKASIYQSELHDKYLTAFDSITYEVVMYPYSPARFERNTVTGKPLTSVTLFEASY